MSRSHDARTHRPFGRAAVVFAAYLAIILQVFIVQTHVHASGVLTVAAHEQGLRNDDGREHITDAQDHGNAAICDIIVSSCHSTLAATPFVAGDAVASSEAATIAIRLAPRALTHSWQSRAPPIAL